MKGEIQRRQEERKQKMAHIPSSNNNNGTEDKKEVDLLGGFDLSTDDDVLF